MITRVRASCLVGAGLALTAAWLQMSSVAFADDCATLRKQLEYNSRLIEGDSGRITGYYNGLADYKAGLKKRVNDLQDKAEQTNKREDWDAVKAAVNDVSGADRTYDMLQSSTSGLSLDDLELFKKNLETLKAQVQLIRTAIEVACAGAPPPDTSAVQSEPSDNTTPTAPTDNTTTTSAPITDPAASSSPTDSTTTTSVAPSDGSSPSPMPAPLPPVNLGGYMPPSSSGGGDLPAVWCVIYRDIPSMTPGPHREWSVALPKDIPGLNGVWQSVECNLTFPAAQKERTRLAGGSDPGTAGVPGTLIGGGGPITPLPPTAVGPGLTTPSSPGTSPSPGGNIDTANADTPIPGALTSSPRTPECMSGAMTPCKREYCNWRACLARNSTPGLASVSPTSAMNEAYGACTPVLDVFNQCAGTGIYARPGVPPGDVLPPVTVNVPPRAPPANPPPPKVVTLPPTTVSTTPVPPTDGGCPVLPGEKYCAFPSNPHASCMALSDANSVEMCKKWGGVIMTKGTTHADVLPVAPLPPPLPHVNIATPAHVDEPEVHKKPKQKPRVARSHPNDQQQSSGIDPETAQALIGIGIGLLGSRGGGGGGGGRGHSGGGMTHHRQ